MILTRHLYKKLGPHIVWYDQPGLFAVAAFGVAAIQLELVFGSNFRIDLASRHAMNLYNLAIGKNYLEIVWN